MKITSLTGLYPKFICCFLIAIHLISCSKTYDTLDSVGPSAKIHLLNIEPLRNIGDYNLHSFSNTIGHSNGLSHQMAFKRVTLTQFNNQQTLDSILQILRPNSILPTFDFEHYWIVILTKTIKGSYLGKVEFQPQLYLDHDDKTLNLVLNHKAEFRNSGSNNDYRDIEYYQWLKIPKPPNGYGFVRL